MRPCPPTLRCRLLFAVALLVLLVGPSAESDAQMLEVPPFVVAVPTIDAEVRSIDVAVGTDGSVLFIWTEQDPGQASGKVVTRRFTRTGTALAPAIRVDTSKHARTPSVVGTALGEYAAVWPTYDHGVYDVRSRLLSPSGAGLGVGDLQLDVDQGATSQPAVVARPSGTAVVWRERTRIWGQYFDQAGTAASAPFEVGNGAGIGNVVDADGGIDGRFVVAWDDNHGSFARFYGADGIALGTVVALPGNWHVLAMATSPVGGFVASGSVTTGSTTLLLARGFDDNGTLLWETPIGTIDGGGESDVVCDALGDVAVVWAGTLNPLQVSAFSPTGSALGPPLVVATGLTFRVRAARLANGTSLVVAWHRSVDEAKAAVVALCGPTAPLCGNGSVDGVCEQCDAGAGNSDTTPDTCRTTCRLPRCGDGIVDAAETCDDGNLASCDGCSSTCTSEAPGWLCGDGISSVACGEQCDDGASNSDVLPDACRTSCRPSGCGDGVVDGAEGCDDGNNFDCDGCSAACVPEPGAGCGDGLVEPTCNESCDDGNTTVGDGCSATCSAELVPGRGSPITDCLVEWSIENPTNVPLLDDGVFRVDQTCHDGDPRCDFDAVAGSCTFHVRVCADDTNLAACEPPERLAGWSIPSPSANKAARDPIAAAIRGALLGTVPGAILGPTTRDLCSPVVDVVVPLRQPGNRPRKVVIKTRADTYVKTKDNDQLKLTCLP